MYLIRYVIIIINATKLSATTSLISKVKYSSQVNLNPSCIGIAIDLKRVSFECIVLFLMVNQCAATFPVPSPKGCKFLKLKYKGNKLPGLGWDFVLGWFVLAKTHLKAAEKHLL